MQQPDQNIRAIKHMFILTYVLGDAGQTLNPRKGS
jgi:hypothetical protein